MLATVRETRIRAEVVPLGAHERTTSCCTGFSPVAALAVVRASHPTAKQWVELEHATGQADSYWSDELSGVGKGTDVQVCPPSVDDSITA
jgi:hypothetical protein